MGGTDGDRRKGLSLSLRRSVELRCDVMYLNVGIVAAKLTCWLRVVEEVAPDIWTRVGSVAL